MNLRPLPLSTHRFDGCTLTGALSITTQVTDGVTIVHGPAGCAHHNFSLLHATLQESGEALAPHLISSRLDEESIIFGGEEALEQTIRSAISMDAQSVFVVSTCIADTIGDDVGAVCAAHWDVPVIYIPTSGFLAGRSTTGSSRRSSPSPGSRIPQPRVIRRL